MRRKILGILIGLMMISSQVNNVWATAQWREDGSESSIAGTENSSDIDTISYQNIVQPLDRLLAKYRMGLQLQYLSASTITVTAGECVLSNSGGTARLFQRNTSSSTLGWSNIDSGSEAVSQQYYVYGYINTTSTTTISFFISTSSSAPTGATYFLRLGSFYNNSSGDIERIINDNYTTQWEIDGTETQLDQADEIDMQSKKIINLATPTADADAATKAYADTAAGLADGAVTQAKLATTTSEQSLSAVDDQNIAVTGGAYCFWPQVKASSIQRDGMVQVFHYLADSGDVSTSYATYVYLKAGTGTWYTQFRYVTSSGTDYWLFLLIDKSMKEILSASAAPDHPAYGNGGDFVKTQHPFLNYDSSKHYIILVEKDQTDELRAEAKDKETTLLTLINDDYKVDWQSAPKYVPLHSGKFLGQEKVLIQNVPEYIKIKNLIKLTDPEKVAREEKRDQKRQAREQAKIDKEAKKQSAIEKLKTINLTNEEIEALIK